MIRRLVKRLKRFLKPARQQGQPYPQTIEITEHSPQPVKFLIHSDTERFRTKNFGGESEQIGIFLKHLQTTDIVYDIGASIGLTALLSAAWASQGQVIAFEPDVAIKERLEANIRLNAFSNITVLSYAISKSNQELRFYSAGADNVSPSLSGKNVKNLQLDSSLVQARTVDSLIADKEIRLPTVLKIDIEGAEHDALLGATKLLHGELGPAPRLIFIELHPDFLPSYNTNIESIRQFIRSAAYQLVWQQERDAQIHEIYIRE